MKLAACHADTTRVVIKIVHSFKHREELVRGWLGVPWEHNILRRRKVSFCSLKTDHVYFDSGCREQITCGFWKVRITLSPEQE